MLGERGSHTRRQNVQIFTLMTINKIIMNFVYCVNAYKLDFFLSIPIPMTFYDDIVNMAVRVMRDNATTFNKCPACSKKRSDIPSGNMSHLTSR